MAGLRDAELLDAWERGAGAAPTVRGAELVDAGDATLADAARRAAAVYVETFGTGADVLLGCAQCGDTLELVLDLRAAADAPPVPMARTVPGAAGDLVVRALEMRDLAAAASAAEPVTALLRRTVTRSGAPVAPTGLGPGELEAVDDAARELAGVAASTVRTTCPTCQVTLAAGVDIAGLLWDAVDRRARTLLAQITTLAAAFGWSEAEVLALSPQRRLAYLELVGP